MTKWLISLILFISAGAAPAGATVITVPGGSGEDRVTVLRGLAEIMINESRTLPGEGEELVVRPGGTAGRAGTDSSSAYWNDSLKKLGESIELGELPGTVSELRSQQAEAFKNLLDSFKRLSSMESSSAEEQHELAKDIQRQVSVIQEDQLILAAMQNKVDTALAGTADGAQMAALLGSQKDIADSLKALQGYQNESAKMLKTDFKTSSKSPGPGGEQLFAEAGEIGKIVDGLARTVDGQPSGLSQDWFREGQEELHGSLKQLEELKQRLAQLLEKDPRDGMALAALKMIGERAGQISGLLRDFAVKEVTGEDLASMQELRERIPLDIDSLKRSAEDMKTAGTKEDLAVLFEKYDRLMERSEEARKLYEQRLGSGQKYTTSEQAELEAGWNSLSAAIAALGLLGDEFRPATRDAVWTAFLKEKEATENATQGSSRQFELINDVTSETLRPLTPLTTQLDGARLGDLLMKNGVAYGVAVRDLGDSTLSMANDASSIKRVELIVFKLQNGHYTSATLGTYQVYNGAVHAAVNIDLNGSLDVFLDHTTSGNKNMTGALYKLDKDTLAQNDLSELAFGDSKGWYPRIAADGTLEHLFVDFSGNEYSCTGLTCSGTVAAVREFQEETSALKAWHSGNVLDAAAYPDELPASVVVKRLNGRTEAEQLGAYSYLSWGRWNDGTGPADSIYVNSPWIAGSLTPAAGIPAGGSATYNGAVLGKINENGVISSIGGTTTLTAGFTNRTLTGSFDMTKNGAAWQGAAVNASWAAASGSISGRLTTDDSAMSGAIRGNFFGPAADQVGGAWNLQNSDASSRAAGVFTGEKQPVTP